MVYMNLKNVIWYYFKNKAIITVTVSRKCCKIQDGIDCSNAVHFSNRLLTCALACDEEHHGDFEPAIVCEPHMRKWVLFLMNTIALP